MKSLLVAASILIAATGVAYAGAMATGEQIGTIYDVAIATGEIFPRVTAELKQRGIDDVLLFCGGIIPEADIPAIKAMGFQAVFGPGTDTNDIIAFLREHAPERD